jgi:tRNA threonylcarbamoyl adenosine modification protein YeaZ
MCSFTTDNIPNPSDSPIISLAVETSGRTGSVALGIGDSIVTQTALSGFQKNGSELLPVVSRILSLHHLLPGNINHVYIPNGPGSFTGIRIAVTLAKMASLTANVQLVAVNTLETIAYNALEYFKSQNVDYARILSILDAKKGFFYTALFEYSHNNLTRLTDDMLLKPAEILEQLAQNEPKLYILGEGLLYYQSQFESPNTIILDKAFWSATAKSVWQIARAKALASQFDNPNTLVPLYIRKPEAEENWERANSR